MKEIVVFIALMGQFLALQFRKRKVAVKSKIQTWSWRAYKIIAISWLSYFLPT
jgi:hypothetical protein